MSEPAGSDTYVSPPLVPDDEANRELLSRVHPADWQNPQASGTYNLVVVGAGTAGLVTAAAAAGLGARVALVERHLMGGDCLNFGCVPSKLLIRAGRAYAHVRDAARYGVHVPPGTNVDFSAVMLRMRAIRAGISAVDSAERFRSLGVDVYFGQAEFQGPDTLRVGDQALRFHRAAIATGGRPRTPPIPGLEEVGYYTNETIFNLTELPRRLAVIGAGAIGCELAQAFARCGNEVSLIEAEHGVLVHEEPDAALLVQQSLEADGVRLYCCGKSLEAARTADGKRLSVHSHDVQYHLEVDEILVATGRAPNVEGLGLEAAGVRVNRGGIEVNDQLQTSNPRIYAAGDVATRYKFTHVAEAMARIVVQNALVLGRAKASALVIPWCTYTDPEVAHVGLYPREAAEQGVAVDVFEQKLDDVDRAVIDGRAEGFVRVLTARGTDRIVGATIVGEHAGELIGLFSQAMTNRLGLKSLAKVILPYPTESLAIKRVADAYNRTRLKPWIAGLLKKWFAWRR